MIDSVKKVLIITYYWPPAGGSGVQRWVKFAKFLPGEGWLPVIYTPLNPEISSVDETLLSEIPAGTEVVKTRITEPYAAYRALMGAKSSTDMKSLIADSSTKNNVSEEEDGTQASARAAEAATDVLTGASADAQRETLRSAREEATHLGGARTEVSECSSKEDGTQASTRTAEAATDVLTGASADAQRETLRSAREEATHLGGARMEAAVNATGGEVNPISGGAKSFKQKLSLFIRGNFFIPDPRVWWVRPSVRFLKKSLKEHPVDAIVTTGPPQSMHLIGRKLSAATGIPWIPDFRDPWTKMFYFKHLRLTKLAEKKHRNLEQKVLDDAAAVIAVSPFVQRDFQAQTSTPVHLITNGFDSDDFRINADIFKTNVNIWEEKTEAQEDGNNRKTEERGDAEILNDRSPDGTFLKADGGSEASQRKESDPRFCEGLSDAFTITHTGLFAADGNPETLWDVLQEMCGGVKGFRDALQIRLAGKVDGEIIASLQSRGLPFVQLGYVSHEEAVREQQAARMLILPLRQDPEYRKVLPGKVFEYLASRRPVLGIGQEDGAAAELLTQTGAGVMCDWDRKEALRAVVEEQWRRYLAGDRSAVDSRIEQYERRALTRQLAALLDAVCRK